MEIDIDIERISNGFIVTGNDETRVKTFYPTVEKIIESLIVEDIRLIDKSFRESHSHGEKRHLTFNLNNK